MCLHIHTRARRPSLPRALRVTSSCALVIDGFPDIFEEIEAYRSAATRRETLLRLGQLPREEQSLTGKLSSSARSVEGR